MDKTKHSIIRRVAFIGNYMPRQCGIATFTTDLCKAIADEYKGTASNWQYQINSGFNPGATLLAGGTTLLLRRVEAPHSRCHLQTGTRPL